MKSLSWIVRRLLAHFRAASETLVAEGTAWYANARATIKDLARRYLVTEATAAGVVAAVSPRVHWKHNLKLAHALLGNYYERGCFRANVDKALRIIAGERPLKVLSGTKVRSFYRALMGDHTMAVVDVWMMRAVDMLSVRVSKAYPIIAAGIKEAAKLAALPTAQFQAVVWSVVRGRSD